MKSVPPSGSPAPQVPTWVHAAAKRPVAFAQVREDPRLDCALVAECARRLGAPVSVLQIASGGCTVAVLAGLPQVSELRLVDPNPAQLALTRIKLQLLQHASVPDRLALLGHSAVAPAQRARALRELFAQLELPANSCGALDDVAAEGLDHCGRYELVFAALRHHLAAYATDVTALLRLHDCAEQQRRIAHGTDLGDALDAACAASLALTHLVTLFGAGATRQAAQPFHAHFAARVRHACATLPAATNPFLWQMLSGTYPPGHVADWITQPAPSSTASSTPTITWTNSTMEVALANLPHSYHVIHLSNMVDWQSPTEASQTLKLAWQALRPGGRIIIRQLNSSLDIPGCGPDFSWQTNEAAALHAQDRSFFYTRLHLGSKL